MTVIGMADVLTALRGVDLNVLVVFDALMQEGSVTRAGKRLGLSQSATSGALARLRSTFGDQLFVRTAHGVEPTPRAEQLIGPVREGLNCMRVALEAPAFDPATTNRQFRVALSDYASIRLLGPLLDNLSRRAPNTTLHVVSASGHDASEILDADIELAIGLYRNSGPSIRQQRLWTSPYKCAVRKEHPVAERPMTLDRYVSLGHVLVSPAGKRIGAVDRYLADIDRTRSVDVVVPDWTIGAMLVANTDYVLSGPSGVIDVLASLLDLVAKPVPRSVRAKADVDAVWHRRHDDDPGHVFLREVLDETARAVRA